MAFRMRLNGNRISDSLFRKLVQARDMKTHGNVELVEAIKVNGDCRVTFAKKDGERHHRHEVVAGVTEIKDLGDGRFELTTSDGAKTFEGVESVTRPEGVEFKVTMAGGKVRKLGETRVFNLVHADVLSEPARRAAWKASHPSVPKAVKQAAAATPSAVTPRAERFSKEDSENSKAEVHQ